MDKFDKPTMRARFWELMKTVDDFDARANPMRAEMDELVAKSQPFVDQKNDLGKKIRAMQAEFNLGEVKGEMSFISKGLGGKVGKRPGSE